MAVKLLLFCVRTGLIVRVCAQCYMPSQGSIGAPSLSLIWGVTG